MADEEDWANASRNRSLIKSLVRGSEALRAVLRPHFMSPGHLYPRFKLFYGKSVCLGPREGLLEPTEWH